MIFKLSISCNRLILIPTKNHNTSTERKQLIFLRIYDNIQQWVGRFFWEMILIRLIDLQLTIYLEGCSKFREEAFEKIPLWLQCSMVW